ncbi:hypothetical protein LSAT2_019523 [Lamellibrachia satsuma]|nr:hypothetical protein LSAT2_019523 [Lamellibrachia satsuma]
MSVDTYLENVILESMDRSADDETRVEIQEYAKKINDIAYKVESNRTELQSEEIVSELVHAFLIPEAQKQSVRQKVQQQQRKHLLAAHREIHKTGEETIEMNAVEIDARPAQQQPERHRSTLCDPSSIIPSTTSAEDSSLENMLHAIEGRHMRDKSVISEVTVQEVSQIISEAVSIQSTTEVSSSSSSSSSSEEDDDEVGSQSSGGSTSSEEYKLSRHMQRGTTLFIDDRRRLTQTWVIKRCSKCHQQRRSQDWQEVDDCEAEWWIKHYLGETEKTITDMRILSINPPWNVTTMLTGKT